MENCEKMGKFCKIKIETFLESARFSWKFLIGKFKKAEFDGKMIYEKNFLHFPSSKRKKNLEI